MKNDKKRLIRVSVSLILVLVMLTVSVGMCFIPRRYTEFDITSSQRYTVSEETQKFLSRLDESVTVYVLNADGSNPQLETFIERYAQACDNVKAEYISTEENTNFLPEWGYSQDEAFSPYSLMVCGERRSQLVELYSMYYYVNEKLGITDMSYSDYNYYYALFSSSESYAMYLDALIYSSELYFRGDAVLTGVLEYVTLDIVPHTYLITGHGENSVNDGKFATLLGSVGHHFEAHDITKSGGIPEDAGCIVINEPTTDYTDSETELVLNYLKLGGRLLLVTDEDNVSMKNLMSIAEYYGTSTSEGLISEFVESESEDGEETDEHFITAVVNDGHDMLASFKYAVDFRNATAIKVSDDLRKAQLVTPIITTSENAYIGDENAKQTYNLGVAIEEETEQGTTKLVWFTGADSFNGEESAKNNLALMVYSLVWMSETYTSSVGEIDAVRYSDAMLNVSSGIAVGLGAVLTLIIPASILTCGLIVNSKRRKA